MNTIEEIKVVDHIDECPDLSWLDQFERSKDTEEQKYYKRDQERKEQYNNDQWHMVGITAQATIRVKTGDSCILQWVESPGLWGIESDSEPSYLASVAVEELEQLKEMLIALNVNMDEWIQKKNQALSNSTF